MADFKYYVKEHYNFIIFWEMLFFLSGMILGGYTCKVICCRTFSFDFFLIIAFAVLKPLGWIITFGWFFSCQFGYFSYIRMRIRPKSKGRKDIEIAEQAIYGNAHVATEAEMSKVLNLIPIEKAVGEESIIGAKNDNEVYVLKKPKKATDFRVNGHKFVCAGSGRGKTRTQVYNDILQAITRGASVIASDPKLEIADEIAVVARNHGVDVKILNFIDPSHSDAINYFDFIQGDVNRAMVFAQIVYQNCVTGCTNTQKDFWASAGESLLTSIALLLTIDDKSKHNRGNKGTLYEANFTTLHDIITKDAEEIDEIFEGLDRNSIARASYKGFKGAKPDIRTSVLFSLENGLKPFINPALQNATSHSDVNILDIAKKPTIVLVGMSDTFDTLNFMAALFFTFSFIELFGYADRNVKPANPSRKKKCDVDVQMILDELPSIGRIPKLTDRISTARSRGIGITLIVQDVGQLEDIYYSEGRNKWTSIIASCDIIIYMGSNNPASHKYFSELCGTFTAITKSKRTNLNRTSIFYWFFRNRYAETEQPVRAELYTPDDIKTLPDKKELVFIKSQPVMELDKFDYSNHPLYKEIETIVAAEHKPLWQVKEEKQKLESKYIGKRLKNEQDQIRDEKSKLFKQLNELKEREKNVNEKLLILSGEQKAAKENKSIEQRAKENKNKRDEMFAKLEAEMKVEAEIDEELERAKAKVPNKVTVKRIMIKSSEEKPIKEDETLAPDADNVKETAKENNTAAVYKEINAELPQETNHTEEAEENAISVEEKNLDDNAEESDLFSQSSTTKPAAPKVKVTRRLSTSFNNKDTDTGDDAVRNDLFN